MHNGYQNQQYNNFENSTNTDRLSNSQISTSLTVTKLQAKLPPISQFLLSRFRGQKLKLDYFSSKLWDANIFFDFFCGKQNGSTISMCNKCQRTEHQNFCCFILQMIEQKYDWRNDIKFKSSYEFYNKKKINIFLTDQQIEYRLMSKFNILGILLLQNRKYLLTKTDKLLLMRIIKNYIKHTIYYGEQKKLTLENDYYFWFLVGIYYHVGVPKYFNDLQSLPKDSIGVHEPMMFWMLDLVMKKLQQCTQRRLKKVSAMALEYCQFFYSKECKSLSQFHDINLQQIFDQWTTQGMMGYMGVQFIGFYIKCIMKHGYQYIQKTIMSYFQKRTMKLQKDQIVNFNQQHRHIQSNNNNNSQLISHYHNSTKLSMQSSKRDKKEQIMKILLDSNEEWPGIFFNTNVYDLKG